MRINKRKFTPDNQCSRQQQRVYNKLMDNNPKEPDEVTSGKYTSTVFWNGWEGKNFPEYDPNHTHSIAVAIWYAGYDTNRGWNLEDFKTPVKEANMKSNKEVTRKFYDSQLQHIYDGMLENSDRVGYDTYTYKTFLKGYQNSQFKSLVDDRDHDFDKAFALWLAGFDRGNMYFYSGMTRTMNEETKQYLDSYVENNDLESKITTKPLKYGIGSEEKQSLSPMAQRWVSICAVASLEYDAITNLSTNDYNEMIKLARELLEESVKD